MENKIIVNVINGEMSMDEQNTYINIMKEKYHDRDIKSIDIKIDGDFVDIETHFSVLIPFNRIRRITGYLNGDVRGFNNAKQKEVADRVKHTV